MSWIYLTILLLFHIYPFHVHCSYAYGNKVLKAIADPNYLKTWMYIPDEQGFLHKVSLKFDASSYLRLDKDNDNPNYKATFWLFTKKYKKIPIELKSSGKLNMTNFQFTNKFNGKKPTKIIVHGWIDNRNSASIQKTKKAYLEKAGNDYNIVAVDWEDSASDIIYFNAAYASTKIGEFLAYVINHMQVKHGVKLKDLHIIGYSLGAHVAGIAGSIVQTLTGKKVGRITGLDPALPYFEDISNTNMMLDSSDAEFVDVIHTCAGILGHDKNLGHVDFYPNSGSSVQPGCDFILNDFFGVCSHYQSIKFFAATITKPNKYMAMKCPSWKHFKKQKCSGGKIPMGNAVPRSARGVYYLRTRSSFFPWP